MMSNENILSQDLNSLSSALDYTEKESMNFLKKLTNNRVLDLYLKYMGITLISPAALVPFGLLLGRDFFEYSVNKLSQVGGRIPKIPSNLPIVDDELFGFYLKMLGLGSLSNISPITLIPLGIVMYLYDNFVVNQVGGGRCSSCGCKDCRGCPMKGGRVTMPSAYYNPSNIETYVPSTEPYHSGWKAPEGPPSTKPLKGGEAPYGNIQLDSQQFKVFDSSNWRPAGIGTYADASAISTNKPSLVDAVNSLSAPSETVAPSQSVSQSGGYYNPRRIMFQ